MGSTSKELREKQLEIAVTEFDAYKATIKEKGLSDKEASKNTLYRQLQASVKKARKRILAIDAKAAHVAAMKEKDTKAEKVAKEKKVAAAAPDAAKTKSPKKKKK
ncbi:MAG: hypothetical protein JXX14_05645 [Deltaproteobacteria bacterium]|nr:hypothetical protein [Deltaproteobacteria bacterium]